MWSARVGISGASDCGGGQLVRSLALWWTGAQHPVVLIEDHAALALSDHWTRRVVYHPSRQPAPVLGFCERWHRVPFATRTRRV